MRGKVNRDIAAGSQGRAHRFFLAFVLALVVAAFAAAGATAAITRPYQSSLGPFSESMGIAVDQSNGDVYVSAQNSGEVSRFDATGAPKNFTAGPNAGTNILTSPGFHVRDVAVDNSAGPLAGDVYVSGGRFTPGFKPEIDVFSSSGETLGILDGSGTGEGKFGSLFGMAVDRSTGDLYIAQGVNSPSPSRIWRYRPNSPSGPIDDADYTVMGIRVGEPFGIALSSGYVYAIDENGTLKKYPLSAFSSALPELSADPILENVVAVSADSKTGEIYADRGNRITVIDQTTDSPSYNFGLNADFARSTAVAVQSAPSGPAVKAYVADGRARQVDVYGPPENKPFFSRVPRASFGADGSSSSSFAEVSQLGFDQAAGKLYALDSGVPGIYGFDATSPTTHPGLAGFGPLASAATGEFPGLAIDNSGSGSAGNLHFASRATGLLYGFDDSGAALGGAFPVDPATNPGPPNGSPKNLCGVAVDSNGDVLVSNAATNRILRYSSTGASLPGTIDTSAQGSGPCWLAFDSADNLYVDFINSNGGTVWRYSAASGYTSATLIDDAGNAARIAADPSNDHLYVVHTPGLQPSWVDVYDSAGNLLEEFTTDFGIRGIAIDAASGEVYLAAAQKIHALAAPVLLPELAITSASAVTNTSATFSGTIGPQGVALSDCHFEYVSEAAFGASGFTDLSSGGSVPCNPASGSIPADSEPHPVSAAVSGLVRNTTYRFRLVAANANGPNTSSDLGFETIGPPLVETTGSPVRTTATARLDSRVDPRGAPATYYFEYGDQGACDSNPCTATEPHSAGSGSEVELVSQQLEGLQPNTTYHYRVIADNGNPDGPVVGEDMTLNTFGEEAPLTHGHLPGPVGSDRAWELVSAPDTGGNPVGTSFAPGAATISDAGDRAVYGVAGGTPLSEGGSVSTRLFAERTSSGWVTKKIYAPREEATGSAWKDPAGPSDLSTLVTENGNEGKSGEFSIWKLKPDAAPVRLFSSGDAEIRGEGVNFGLLLASDDGSRAMISMRGPQDPAHPAAAGVNNLYDVSSGSPQLVSLLPDGAVPACGIEQSGVSGPGIPTNNIDRSAHWVSADGSLLFFPSRGNECGGRQDLYVRDIPAEETRLISTPPVSGPDCNAVFIKSIGSSVYFYTRSRLAGEDVEPAGCSGESGPGGDVYRYDFGDGSLDCLTCVIPGLEVGVIFAGTGKEIDRSIGVASDGSRIYFTSDKRLASGAPEKEGLYRLDVASGQLAYVGSFGFVGDAGNSTMTPDGSVVVFNSKDASLNALGGQQNGGTTQSYRYDDRDRSLICVSCPADGSLPRGEASGGARGGPGANSGSVSADGNILAFSTPTPLVAADQNTAPAGQAAVAGTDVYEWREGRLLLVSDGLINWPGNPPQVSGVTPSGHDIFFTAAAQYTPDALDGYKRLYDARIGGGFEFPPPPKPCPLEVCQGTPQGAPEEQAPGTATIAGAGNAAHKVKAKKKHHKRRHKKHAKKAAKNKANNNRRSAR